jgi:hypothetical protein
LYSADGPGSPQLAGNTIFLQPAAVQT